MVAEEEAEEAEVDKIIVITKTQKKKNRQNIKIMKTKKLTEALVEIEEEVAEATEVIVVAEEEVVAVKAMDSIMRSSNMTQMCARTTKNKKQLTTKAEVMRESDL